MSLCNGFIRSALWATQVSSEQKEKVNLRPLVRGWVLKGKSFSLRTLPGMYKKSPCCSVISDDSAKLFTHPLERGKNQSTGHSPLTVSTVLGDKKTF
jgi:hypothetical protein